MSMLYILPVLVFNYQFPFQILEGGHLTPPDTLLGQYWLLYIHTVIDQVVGLLMYSHLFSFMVKVLYNNECKVHFKKRNKI
jgi:hypothetical protein